MSLSMANDWAEIAQRRERLADGEWLRRAYVEDRRSCASIATEIGCATPTVRKALIRNDIPMRRPGRARHEPT
jgi:hypothetical protein